MNFISTVIAVIKVIPAIKSWFESLIAAYVAAEIAAMKKENREAIRRAFDEHDQRPLEFAIGNPNAGEHSGIEGTEIRDSLPGVKP